MAKTKAERIFDLKAELHDLYIQKDSELIIEQLEASRSKSNAFTTVVEHAYMDSSRCFAGNNLPFVAWLRAIAHHVNTNRLFKMNEKAVILYGAPLTKEVQKRNIWLKVMNWQINKYLSNEVELIWKKK